LMEDEDADDVRRLLTYPENTAGGIMNTEFVAVRPDFTAEQAIKHLRQNAEDAETVFYVYVTNEGEQLVGVFSLLELVLAKPTKLVSEFMEKRVVAVKLSDSQDECAQVVSKYNLIAVPVIDEAKRLHGIVTVDDALDQIIPTAWKKRLPRFFH
jgi:magnesium transporter